MKTAKSRRHEVDLVEPPERRRRPLRYWVLGAALLVAASVAVVVTTQETFSQPPDTVKLSGGAKIFRLEEVREGRKPVALLDFQGKPVVLNFFGSWCPPCLRELPDLQAVSERYGGRVAFVGVTFNDTRPGARDVLRRSGVTYPAGFDPENKVALAYGLRRMPTTVFISPEGRLLERAERELSEQQLESIIERLYFS
jgi:thiol-disulfide isomerase/thioredoxin